MRIEMGKKYRYKLGGVATILTVDRPHNYYSVIAMNELGELTFHSSDGINVGSRHNDLIEVKEERVRYINIYEDSGYVSLKDANRYAGKGRLACVKIVYTEGQFDE